MSDLSTTYASTNTSGRTLSAFFDTQRDAEHASQRLLDLGLPASSVRLVPGNESDTPVADTSEHRHGFFGALADFFMPEEDRYSYAEGLSRGGFLVVVSGLSDTTYDRALDILDDEGAVDFDAREETWRSEGWTGYNAEADQGHFATSADARVAYDSDVSAGRSAYGATDVSGSTSTGSLGSDTRSSAIGDDEVIPVIDEQLVVGKRDVNLGRVRVRSYVREEPVSADVNLRDERVTIERRPVDRALGAGDVAFTDRTIEAEEHAEEAVIAKQARVTEEISLRKDSTERTETVSDTVRKTEVEVEDDRDLDIGQRTTR
ncbi:MAG: hypothetical protein JWR75_1678 [Devosia sp.]|nr:hypothetical protein [Devosia sp.]